MAQTIYALLVGINHYASPTVPNLGGCVNDVEAIATLLQEHFAVPPAHIKTLVDSQATYHAVKSQFRQHLIESVRSYVAEIGAVSTAMPPAVLFHFSGHGSQAPDHSGQEPDGFDETLVCHDSRLPDLYDLKDWELGQLLDELAVYTENITVILDCCHSGSGTRADAKLIAHTRSCSPDLRPQPVQRPVPVHNLAVATASTPTPVRRSTGSTGQADQNHWARGHANHVLLAACRDQEKALEYIPATTTAHGPEARRHGVLTYYLMPLLRKLDRQNPPTYRELYETLSAAITRNYPQTPQCEGDWGRLFFGGSRPDRSLWLTVLDQREGLYWINAGMAHGIGEGARFAVYRPGARTVEDGGEPIGLLTVVEVGAVQAGCVVQAQQEPIPMQARLMQLDGGTRERSAIFLAVDNGMIAEALRIRLAQQDLAGVVALVGTEEDAALRIALVDNALEIHRRNSQRLGNPYPLRLLNRMRRPLRAADLDPVAEDLARIVRAQRLDLLQNIGSDLADALVLTIRRLAMDPTTGAVIAGDVIAGSAKTIDHVTAPPAIQVGEPVVIEITNQGDEALYIGLLLRSGAWSVEPIYPEMRGAHEQLVPGRTIQIGLHNDPARRLHFTITGAEQAEEISLLLIGTVAATDFDALLQQELHNASRQQARQTMDNAARPLVRAFQMGGAARVDDEWMVQRLTVRVVAT